MTVESLRSRNLFGKALEAENPGASLVVARLADLVDDGSASGALVEKAHELEEQGDHRSAYLCLVRAVAIKEEDFGPDHWDTAMRLTDLAAFLERTDRVAEARPLRFRALEVFERTDFGTAFIPTTHQALASAAEAAGELDEAERHWRAATEFLSDKWPHVLAEARFKLAEYLFRQERWAESLTEAIAAATFWRTEPHHRIDVARAAALTAVDLMYLERYGEAIPHLEEIADIQGVHGPDHDDVVFAHTHIAICRENMGV
jgi:tetratricopeptide (TPR) repeat protein